MKNNDQTKRRGARAEKDEIVSPGKEENLDRKDPQRYLNVYANIRFSTPNLFNQVIQIFQTTFALQIIARQNTMRR